MAKGQGLTIRKLADRSDGRERIAAYDPVTDVKFLANPKTGKPDPWPLAGIEVVGDPPKYTTVSTKWVQARQIEGVVELVNERVVHRPGGPASDPWRVTHTFNQADAIVLKTVNGDVRYEVYGKRGQPDKYLGDSPTNEAGIPEAEIEWFYNLRLVE